MPYMPYHRRKAPTLLDEEALDRALQEKTSRKDDNTDSTQVREEPDESDTKPKSPSIPLHASFSKVVLLDEDALRVAWKAKEKRRHDEDDSRSRRNLVQHQMDHLIEDNRGAVQAPGRPPRRRRFFLGSARPPKLFASRHAPDDASRETHQLSLATPSTPSPDRGHQRLSDHSLTSRPQSNKLITVTPILKKTPSPQPQPSPPKAPVQVPEHKVQDMKSILESRLVLKTPAERNENDMHHKSLQVVDSLPQEIESEMERPTDKDVQKQSDVIQSMKSLLVSGVALKPTKKSPEPKQQHDTPILEERNTSAEQLGPSDTRNSLPLVDKPQNVMQSMKSFIESGVSLKPTPKKETESTQQVTPPLKVLVPDVDEDPLSADSEPPRPASSGVRSMRQLFESRSTPTAKVPPAWAKKLANANKTPETPALTPEPAPVPQTTKAPRPPNLQKHEETKKPRSSASRRSKSSAVSSASPKKRVVRIMKVRKKNGEIVERVVDDSTNDSNSSPVSRRVVVVKKKKRPKGSKPSSHRTRESAQTAERSQAIAPKSIPRPVSAPVRGKKNSRNGRETTSTAIRSSDTISTLGDPSEVPPVSNQSLDVPSSVHSSNPQGPSSWTVRNTPTSGFQPNQNLDPEIMEYYAENLGGVETVSNTSRIFFYKALSDPDLHEHFKDIRWEDMRNEFLVLANLEVPDQFDERLRSVVRHHCTLMESGADMNLVMSTWESAVEESWKQNSAADPRQLIVGPSRVIFNLKAIERHFAMYRREKQAERRAQNQRALQRRRGGILARLVASNKY